MAKSDKTKVREDNVKEIEAKIKKYEKSDPAEAEGLKKLIGKGVPAQVRHER